MKILLSAYACNPHKGSEPGIGWNWSVNLHRLGHEVTVITRKKNKSDIEEFIRLNSDLAGICFLYYDLGNFYLNKKKYIGVYLYYELWQTGIYNFLKNEVNVSSFDLIHHITFGSFRHPSYLYKFNLPFVFGPLGGGEVAPNELLATFSFKNRLNEYLRLLVNKVSVYRFSLIKSMLASDLVFARTVETYNSLPAYIQKKSIVHIDIGTYKEDIIPSPRILDPSKTINIIFVGRLIYWKGIALAVEAFAKFSKEVPNSVFTVIGSGEEEEKLRIKIFDLGLVDKVILKGFIKHDKIVDEYLKGDIFLFPSLHDAGPLVIFEALRYGLPIVGINIGGVGQLLGFSYPGIISLDAYPYDQCVSALSGRLIHLVSDVEFYTSVSKRSLEIATENTWSNTISSVYSHINERIFSNNPLYSSGK